MGNANTHDRDRRKSGAPETGLTIEDIREKPLHVGKDSNTSRSREKKSSPPSFDTTAEEAKDHTRNHVRRATTQDEEDGVERTVLEAGRMLDSERQGLPTIFKFPKNTAKEVFVAGTFSNWAKIPMVKSHKDFVALVDLPVGQHQYKYYVDEEWTHDKTVPTIDNEVGSQNNVISIQLEDFEAFSALDMDSATTKHQHKRGNEAEFGQDIPTMNSFENKPGPPILPPHLLQVILNKDTPLSCEPTLLPEPNHVMINHLYALSIKDGVMVISSTQRFRKKYVTTLLYKPIEA